MKKVLYFLFPFIVVGGYLFYSHWSVFSSQLQDNDIEIVQNLLVTHNENLVVEQKVENLPHDAYVVHIPDNIQDSYYMDETGHARPISNGQLIRVYNNEIEFIYEWIQSHHESVLLHNWFIKLEGIEIDQTTLKIGEYSWKEGSWTSNSELVGVNQQDLVDYYLFEHYGGDPILYAQSLALETINTNEVTFFRNSDQDPLPSYKETEFPFSFHKDQYVVISEIHPEFYSQDFAIIPPRPQSEMLEKIMTLYIQELFSDKEKWYADVLVGLYLEKPPLGGKANQIFNELKNNLTETQLQIFIQEVSTYFPEQLSARKLDEILSDIYSKRTQFFTDNLNIETPLTPLILVDEREIWIKGKETAKATIVHLHEKELIEFIPIAEQLHYAVEEHADVIEVKKGAIFYRFYPNQPFLDLNTKRYNTKKAPVIRLKEDYFIELNILEPLFTIQVREEDGRITID